MKEPYVESFCDNKYKTLNHCGTLKTYVPKNDWRSFGFDYRIIFDWNDPAVELNPTMSWEINVLAGHQLIEKAIKENVKHFIFASSGSVYGIKDEKDINENVTLTTLTDYSKFKAN